MIAMEVEAVILEPAEGELKRRGVLGFVEVVLTDGEDKITVRGLKVYRHSLTARLKVLYPKHAKLGYTFYTLHGSLMRRVNDAILAKFSEVCELEDLLQVLNI